jgi:hypothetical protein
MKRHAVPHAALALSSLATTAFADNYPGGRFA